jgi:hypothetical protein
MGPFVNQNWVVNFANLVYFGPLTFPFFILVLHHQLGQSFRISSYVSSCILDLFFFLYFSFIFYMVKMGRNICPLFTMLIFLYFLCDAPIQRLHFLLWKNGLVITSDLCHTRTSWWPIKKPSLVYLSGKERISDISFFEEKFSSRSRHLILWLLGTLTG